MIQFDSIGDFLNLVFACSIGSGIVLFVAKIGLKSAVEAAFKKSIEFYKSELTRATAAHKCILDREMKYFDLVDEQCAEMIVLIQDLEDAVEARRFTANDKNCLLRYLEIIPEMKDTALRYEPYVNREAWVVHKDLVVMLQDYAGAIADMFKDISSKGCSGDSDIVAMSRICKKVLMQIARVRLAQGSCLKKLSKS